jgi:hypothetical protein
LAANSVSPNKQMRMMHQTSALMGQAATTSQPSQPQQFHIINQSGVNINSILQSQQLQHILQ